MPPHERHRRRHRTLFSQGWPQGDKWERVQQQAHAGRSCRYWACAHLSTRHKTPCQALPDTSCERLGTRGRASGLARHSPPCRQGSPARNAPQRSSQRTWPSRYHQQLPPVLADRCTRVATTTAASTTVACRACGPGKVQGVGQTGWGLGVRTWSQLRALTLHPSSPPHSPS